MESRKGSLKRSRLYLVLDAAVADKQTLLRVAQEASEAGVEIIQLRDKVGSDGAYVAFANEIIDHLRGKSLFIINDRAHLAENIDADGVHLGQNDISLAKARQILGAEKLIGISCQNLEHLKAAQEQGADYVGFGSVFKTKTKPQREPMDLVLLEEAGRKCKVPLFAIGGITVENVEALLERGIGRVAVTRSICEARDVKGAVEDFKRILGKKEIAGVVQW